MSKLDELNARCAQISPAICFEQKDDKWVLNAQLEINAKEEDAQVLLDSIQEVLEPWIKDAKGRHESSCKFYPEVITSDYDASQEYHEGTPLYIDSNGNFAPIPENSHIRQVGAVLGCLFVGEDTLKSCTNS